MTTNKELTLGERIARDEEFMDVTGETLSNLDNLLEGLNGINVPSTITKLFDVIRIERDIVNTRLQDLLLLKAGIDEPVIAAV